MKIYKTNEVSKLLHISNKKVRSLLRMLPINIEKNDYGHYIITEEHINEIKLLLDKPISRSNQQDQIKVIAATSEDKEEIRPDNSFSIEKTIKALQEKKPVLGGIITTNIEISSAIDEDTINISKDFDNTEEQLLSITSDDNHETIKLEVKETEINQFDENSITSTNNLIETMIAAETNVSTCVTEELLNLTDHHPIEVDVKESHNDDFLLLIQSLTKQLAEQKEELATLKYEISTKANEVVSVQILQHRSELEELYSEIRFLKSIVDEIKPTKPSTQDDLDIESTSTNRKRKGLLSLFSS